MGGEYGKSSPAKTEKGARSATHNTNACHPVTDEAVTDEDAMDLKPFYRVAVSDRIWWLLYEPIGPFVQRVAARFAWLQQGRIATYLLYSFVTLVVLLALVL